VVNKKIKFSSKADFSYKNIDWIIDGEKYYTTNPSHVFKEVGKQQITLIFDDNDKCKIVKTISVEKASGLLQFSKSEIEVEAGQSIYFEDPNPEMSTRTWDFGNGYTTTEKNPEYVYMESGTKIITLKYGNSNDFITQTVVVKNKETPSIVVNPAPEPPQYTPPPKTMPDNNTQPAMKSSRFSASFKVVTEGTPIQFTNQTPNATDFDWDFGDGNTSNEQNPTHTYSLAADEYIVKLRTNVTTAYMIERIKVIEKASLEPISSPQPTPPRKKPPIPTPPPTEKASTREPSKCAFGGTGSTTAFSKDKYSPSCAKPSTDNYQFTITPKQCIEIVGMTVASSDCGSIDISIVDNNNSYKAIGTLSKGLSQINTFDLGVRLEAKNTYTITCSTTTSSSCGTNNPPVLMDATGCNLKKRASPHFDIGFNGKSIIYDLQYEY